MPPNDEEAELQARLEKAQAARAEREQANAARAKLDRLREDAEREELALKEDEIIDGLVVKYGPLNKAIRIVRTSEGMIVVKKPNHLIFRRYQDKGETKTQDLEQLVRPCLVHPDRPAFERIIEEVPAALMRAANAVCVLAGVGKEDIAGK